MLVHGNSQRGRRTILGETAQERAHLTMRNSLTAQGDGYLRGKHLARLQRLIILVNEFVLALEFGGLV